MIQKHWLAVYHADYRKLKNQARFIKEIIDGELIVGRKRKGILVQELRERKYEAFPRKGDKQKSTEDEANEEDDEEGDEGTTVTGSAGDYDYLLSVRYLRVARCEVTFAFLT